MRYLITALLLTTSCFGGTLTNTTAEVQKSLSAIDYGFVTSLIDGGSTNVISAATPIRFTCDGASRNFVSAAGYITNRWDTVNSKISFSTETDTPVYTAIIGFTFNPDVAAAGTITITAFIDDDTPKEIRAYTVPYKASPATGSVTASWYLGTDAGYDAKNDGVYFEFQASGAGELYGRNLTIYRD